MSPVRTAPGWLLLATLLASVPAAADSFVVIRSARNSTASATTAEVRELFTGRARVWSDGSMVQPVLEGEGAASLRWLAEALFGVNDVTLLTKIKQEVFKGELKRPLACSGGAECAALVKANRGAIAVVARETPLPAGVAVLELSDGRPGKP